MLRELLHAYGTSRRREFSHDRLSTLGSSGQGRCIRQTAFQLLAVPPDTGFVDSWGAALRGTVYEDQILTLALQGKDLRKLVVREVMSAPLPKIPKTAPVERVTRILSHENPAVFVEMDETRFEILTKYDLMSTVASLMEQKR